MASNRLTLQTKLENVLGSRNVYYNPPESQKMNFPCIVYNLTNIQPIHADNQTYLDYTTYKIIYVSKQVDSPTVRDLLNIPMTRFSTKYVKNGFWHTVIILNQKEKQ